MADRVRWGERVTETNSSHFFENRTLAKQFGGRVSTDSAVEEKDDKKVHAVYMAGN